MKHLYGKVEGQGHTEGQMIKWPIIEKLMTVIMLVMSVRHLVTVTTFSFHVHCHNLTHHDREMLSKLSDIICL